MKAVYAGTFDCYTNGHHFIVRKACRLFDEVHLVIAENLEKKRVYPAAAMAGAIKETLRREHIGNCRVSIYHGLVAEYCQENQINYFVRGLRNNLDYSYEENVAEVNKLINPEMDTIYFRAEDIAISSSMVKELHSFGRDVSCYVPPAVWDYIRNSERRSVPPKMGTVPA